MSEGMDALVMARELSKRLAALEAKVSKLDFDISVLCSVTGASLAPQTTPPQPAPQEGEWVVHREDLARAVERAEKSEAERDAALTEIGDQARRYEAQLFVIRKAMGGYDDSDLVSLATTLKANSDALSTAHENRKRAESDAATARGERERLKTTLHEIQDVAEHRGGALGTTAGFGWIESTCMKALSSSPPPATEKAQETNSTGWPTRCGGDGSLMRWAPTTKPEHKPCPGCPDCKSEVKS